MTPPNHHLPNPASSSLDVSPSFTPLTGILAPSIVILGPDPRIGPHKNRTQRETTRPASRDVQATLRPAAHPSAIPPPVAHQPRPDVTRPGRVGPVRDHPMAGSRRRAVRHVTPAWRHRGETHGRPRWHRHAARPANASPSQARFAVVHRKYRHRLLRLVSSLYPWQAGELALLEAQQRYRANWTTTPRCSASPSLLDPSWRDRVATRLTGRSSNKASTIRCIIRWATKPGSPIFPLTGTSTCRRFGRRLPPWLRRQYKSLAALNAKWDTAYPTWNAIQPETTNGRHAPRPATIRRLERLQGLDGHRPSPTRCDFGTDAVHRGRPPALSAIEGVQLPGWGGYDYTKTGRTRST